MTLANRNRFVVALALFLLASAADAATYLTTLRTPLYASPSTKSVWLAALPAGVAVEVSSCSKNWCSGAWSGQRGWIARHHLKPAKSQQQSTGHGYRNSDGQWIPSRQLSPNGPPHPEPRRNAEMERTASRDTTAAPAPTTAGCGGGFNAAERDPVQCSAGATTVTSCVSLLVIVANAQMVAPGVAE